MRTTEPQAFSAKLADPQHAGSADLATRRAATRPPLSATVPALIIVLLFHAALLVADLVEGPKWLAAAEGLLALLVGLFALRRLEAPDDSSSS
jgi:uncharacterized membrane protein